MWNYPLFVEIDGKNYEIEKKCDYRVVLDCFCVYEDNELNLNTKHLTAMTIFYKNAKEIKNVSEAVKKMLEIIDYAETESKPTGGNLPEKYMSWEKDFPIIAPAVSRILGYDVRNPDKYTHWYSFIGAYMEIGECLWSTVISIRTKLKKHKKLEDWEKTFYREHKNLVLMQEDLTEEEKEFLYS